MKFNNLSRSAGVRSVFKACAKAPFKPTSQHGRWSCRYAPRPAALPVGSIITPSDVFTRRIIVRLGSVILHPIQVRCGTCLVRLSFFAVTSFSLVYIYSIVINLPFFPSAVAAFVLPADKGDIAIWIIFDSNVFLLFLLIFLLQIIIVFIFSHFFSVKRIRR